MGLRNLLDRVEQRFFKDKEGKPTVFHPLYELVDTILYTPLYRSKGRVHVRDGMDYKRMMLIVVYALIPLMIFSFYNVGYQANLAASDGLGHLKPFGAGLLNAFGLSIDPKSVSSNFVVGLSVWLPIFLVTMVVGGLWEVVFSLVRKHEVNEGFFVTGFLFPLIVSPSVPLWQVALGISFGVVVGKEVFGGTGMNIFNPALMARAFLFFAYPAEISGSDVWVAVDGLSAATPLSHMTTSFDMSAAMASFSPHDLYASWDPWLRKFTGFSIGSIGETSTLFIFVGLILLLVTRVASWVVVFGTFLGMVIMSLIFNVIAPYVSSPVYQVPFYWHLVLGGFAFGMTYMVTDPVTGSYTRRGKFYYGLLVGMLCIFIRAVNPAYPEGMMLAILFMNAAVATIDYFVVDRNIKRREARNGAK